MSKLIYDWRNPGDYMPGICFGIGQAVSGAATAAAQVGIAAKQMSMEKDAAAKANSTANTVAGNLQTAGNNANAYYQPYSTIGENALNTLANGISTDAIENTAGFKADNYLGQQGVTNSAAARGLADSGAALKGAAANATTLADNTYQNQFNDTNALANYGYNAASNQSANTMNTAEQAGTAKMQGATALLNGASGAASSLGQGVSGAANSLNNIFKNNTTSNAANS